MKIGSTADFDPGFELDPKRYIAAMKGDITMRKGRVKISLAAIADALKLPPEWEIESIHTNIDGGFPVAEAIISGDDFPEVPKLEGVLIKECTIIFHKEPERLTCEVKEL